MSAHRNNMLSSEDGGPSLGDRIAGLRMALSQQQTRVMDFLRTWDHDGSGEIERKVQLQLV